ncbi:uncharacterized protein [Panulirus ornatus]|uniref:uncharacterized protein n=1 Tax=Panulirus ornatus TaxID=150431 RepID=UPI003A837E3A
MFQCSYSGVLYVKQCSSSGGDFTDDGFRCSGGCNVGVRPSGSRSILATFLMQLIAGYRKLPRLHQPLLLQFLFGKLWQLRIWRMWRERQQLRKHDRLRSHLRELDMGLKHLETPGEDEKRTSTTTALSKWPTSSTTRATGVWTPALTANGYSGAGIITFSIFFFLVLSVSHSRSIPYGC